ncbi:MAG: hypothetical protein ABI318_00450, partial [Chthoniobacteraceae bacterium]
MDFDSVMSGGVEIPCRAKYYITGCSHSRRTRAARVSRTSGAAIVFPPANGFPQKLGRVCEIQLLL